MIKKLVCILYIISISIFFSACNKTLGPIDSTGKLQSVENSIEQATQVDYEEKKDVKETIEESKDENLPYNKTIVIDPGHSSIGNAQKEPIAPNSSQTKAKDVHGATGIYTKIPEHKTTVSISNLVEEKLKNKGYNVVMTKREVETSLSNIERSEIGNENNADLVVRIHADSSDNSSANGASILIPTQNEHTSSISDISMKYGQIIIDSYTEELNIKNRGTIYRDDMTGFNWSKVPVVILEMGFLSNEEEDRFISSIENHEEIATAIVNSISKCFE